MRAVNLLPREATDRRKMPAVPVLVACGGTVLVTLFLAVSFLSATRTVAARKTELADAQSRLNAIPPPVAQSPIVSQLPQQRLDRVSALAAVLGQRIAFDRILREVSQVVPSDVWLQTLGASAPEPATPGVVPAASATPTGFTLTGYTYSHDAVARFLARLEIVPDLTDVSLNSSTATKLGTHKVVQFTISANVRAPGAAS